MSSPPPGQSRDGVYSQEVFERLVGQVRDGDQAAMERLYAILISGLRSFFRRQLPLESVDDRAHNVYIITVSAIRGGQLREPGRLPGFIRTVAQRQAADAIRGLERMRNGETAVEETAVPDGRANPEEALWEQQRMARMRQALVSLSPRDREILTRFYLKEQPVETICEEMGLSCTQFRLLKSRAKARLAEAGQLKKCPGRETGRQVSAGLQHL